MKFATMSLWMELENKASAINRTSCSMKTVLTNTFSITDKKFIFCLL